jgi:hypothetical protein
MVARARTCRCPEMEMIKVAIDSESTLVDQSSNLRARCCLAECRKRPIDLGADNRTTRGNGSTKCRNDIHFLFDNSTRCVIPSKPLDKWSFRIFGRYFKMENQVGQWPVVDAGLHHKSFGLLLMAHAFILTQSSRPALPSILAIWQAVP